MSDSEAAYEDPFGAELGAFDLVADSSAADARQERIAAARKQARTYQAKVEEPGWYNSLSPSARDKDLSRLALFSMHHKYFERDYLQVVEAGCELIRGQVKEQSEVIDLVLRAAVKCDVAVQRRPEVLALAQRWHEYPHLPSLSLSSARILFANSDATSSHADPSSIPLAQVLAASLSSLRLHPSLPIPRSFLASFLRIRHPLLSEAIADPAIVDPRRAEIEAEVERVDLTAGSASSTTGGGVESTPSPSVNGAAAAALSGPRDHSASAPPRPSSLVAASHRSSALDRDGEDAAPQANDAAAEARRVTLRRVIGLQLDDPPVSYGDAAATEYRDVGRNVRSL
ncbi:hypothetical protein BMF94_1542 [Rhodotorula taiwanensis]|uniref:Uncharacterized protein n=1 Tax=Rhodotorula taiwanensis TaxID=741276 RepID=A0A2S5BF43_9BASI|nr:hypothetical protein BMF94_1542 [Rhodotorula taiwanensis]